MDTQITRWLFGLSLVIGLGVSASAVAATCPKVLKQDSDGYWVSDSPPEWKSHRPTSKSVTVKAKNFGGTVYSPEKKRLACVYRSSNNKWIILWSDVNYPINEDDLIGSAWEYNHKHKDYVCGQPKYKLKDCTFKINNK